MAPGADAASPPDLAPLEVRGVVGGSELHLAAASATGESSCGPRGLLLSVTTAPAPACDPQDGGAGDGGADRVDGGSGAGGELRIHLSDRLPGVYLFTGPVTCLAAPGGRGLFATLRADGGDFVAVGGYVLLGAFDERRADKVAEGVIDLSFAPAPAAPAAGRLAGNFVAIGCP